MALVSQRRNGLRVSVLLYWCSNAYHCWLCENNQCGAPLLRGNGQLSIIENSAHWRMRILRRAAAVKPWHGCVVT